MKITFERANALHWAFKYGFELHGESNYDLKQQSSHVAINGFKRELLKQPEEVTDDERNTWLTTASLQLKHHGISLETALDIMPVVAKRIPEASTSRNCRNVKTIVRSIYGNLPDLVGCRPGCAPEWLLEVSSVSSNGTEMSVTPSVSPVATVHILNVPKISTSHQLLFKKGVSPVAGSVNWPVFQTKTSNVAKDGFVGFQGSFYSVPVEYLGRSVKILVCQKMMRVLDSLEEKVISNHRLSDTKGSFVENSKHFVGGEEQWENICEFWTSYFQRKTGSASAILVEEILSGGRQNLRKIWILCGLLKRVGRIIFGNVCEKLSERRQLSYRRVCREVLKLKGV